MSEESDQHILRNIVSGAIAASFPFILLVMNSYVDQYFITLEGRAAASAYTLILPIYWILISAGTVIGGVVTVEIRTHLIKGDIEGAEKISFKAVIYSSILGFLFTVFVVVFLSRFLLSMIPEQDVQIAAKDFLSPIVFLFFGISLNGALCGIVNGTGHHKVYLLALSTSLIGNCILDPYFVEVLDMGVFGNGLGTAVSMLLSSVLLLYWILSGRAGIRLSFKQWEHGIIGREFFPLFGAAMYQVFVQNFSELIIRYFVYVKYALTYGIAMLYSSIVSVIGLGLANSSVRHFAAYRNAGDSGSALVLLKQILTVGFIMMMVLSIAMCLLSSELVDVFLSNPEMEINRHKMRITMEVLVFTAPFTGIKSICESVFLSTSKIRIASLNYTVWLVVKVVIILVLLQYSFHFAIFAILLERVFAAAVMILLSRRYIMRKYVSPIRSP